MPNLKQGLSMWLLCPNVVACWLACLLAGLPVGLPAGLLDGLLACWLAGWFAAGWQNSDKVDPQLLSALLVLLPVWTHVGNLCKIAAERQRLTSSAANSAWLSTH